MSKGGKEHALEQRRADLAGKRMYYQVAGSGPALALVHGLSGSGRWWRKNIPALAEHFTVYALDLVGFGGSRRQRFVLEEAADLLAMWMKHAGEERFHLIGHSMGGMVAAELASRRPECIAGLVLVDAVALPLGHTIARSMMNLAGALRWMRFDFLPVLASDALRAGPLTLLRASYAIHRADLSDSLRRVAARTLIVWGEHDTLLPVSRGEALHHAMPGSEFVVVGGAGHNPMWDRPDAFNALVLNFLLEQGQP